MAAVGSSRREPFGNRDDEDVGGKPLEFQASAGVRHRPRRRRFARGVDNSAGW